MNLNGVPVALAALILGVLAWIFAHRIVEFGSRFDGEPPEDQRQLENAVRTVRIVALSSIPFALFALFVVG